MFSMTQLEGVIADPFLRTVGLMACVVDTTALVTAIAFRLRLKMLSSEGKDENFARVIPIL